MSQLKNIVFLVLLTVLSTSCWHHKVHKAMFYSKLGEQNANHDGYHSNEAQRLLDFNEINKNANQEHAQETQEKISADLNEINKPNKYNSRPLKAKKKKFRFYM
jgi:uncharacterized protein YdbL (DUF1318 family)